jgi:hypothetical protein
MTAGLVMWKEWMKGNRKKRFVKLIWMVMLLREDLAERISIEELDGPAVSVFGVRLWKLSYIGQSLDQKYIELLCASKGTLSRWSRLHL